MKKSILRARILCSVLIILIPLCALIGYEVWRLDLFDRYEVYEVRSYELPDNSLRTLEVRRWEDQDGYKGWDFCLVAPDGKEQLLKRTHALSNAAITGFDWWENGADITTIAPSGGFTLTWG